MHLTNHHFRFAVLLNMDLCIIIPLGLFFSDCSRRSNAIRNRQQRGRAGRVDWTAQAMSVKKVVGGAAVCVYTIFAYVDCRENVVLQDRFHPGLFNSGKWSCCEHRSKHSQGCKDSFVTQPPAHASQPARSGAVARGPLPPTPFQQGECCVCVSVIYHH